MDIYDRIDEALKEKGLNRKELADAIDLSYNSLASCYKRRIETLYKLVHTVVPHNKQSVKSKKEALIARAFLLCCNLDLFLLRQICQRVFGK